MVFICKIPLQEINEKYRVLWSKNQLFSGDKCNIEVYGTGIRITRLAYQTSITLGVISGQLLTKFENREDYELQMDFNHLIGLNRTYVEVYAKISSDIQSVALIPVN